MSGQNNPEQATVVDDSFASPTKKTLKLSLDIEYTRVHDSPDPAVADDLYDWDDYEPRELASLVVYVLKSPDAQSEMFAGSGIFLKITRIHARSYEWDGDAKLSSTKDERPDHSEPNLPAREWTDEQVEVVWASLSAAILAASDDADLQAGMYDVFDASGYDIDHPEAIRRRVLRASVVRAVLAALPPTARHVAARPSPSVERRALTADFTKALPGGKLDDATFEQIESALDRADAPIRDGNRWLTLAERIAAIASDHQPSKEAGPADD